MPYAKAKHILVSSERLANQLRTQIESGADFSEIAKVYSECTTSRHGGSLGCFAPGQMAAQVDRAVFEGTPGLLYGPVVTEFGFHLVITEFKSP